MTPQQKKLKHSKFKNTGILFELLVKQITADVLSGKEVSLAEGILTKYFKDGSELGKELKIYKFLCEEKTKNEFQSEKALDACVKSKQKINESKLNKEKFELIKEIKKSWNIVDFLKGSLTNYKLMASVYKVLEESVRSDLEVDPKELYQAKNFIFEHLSNNKKSLTESSEKDALIKLYQDQSEEMRLLSYKIMVDNFNKKYSILNESQKSLIKEYIYNVSNTNSLKVYIQKEVPIVQSQLIKLAEGVSEPALKIKIKESAKQLSRICEGNVVKDSSVSSLLISYELLKELSSNGK